MMVEDKVENINKIKYNPLWWIGLPDVEIVKVSPKQVREGDRDTFNAIKNAAIRRVVEAERKKEQ